MKKIFSRRSKRHDLIAEFLVESISVRLQSEINTSLKQLLRVQIKATVARFKADGERYLSYLTLELKFSLPTLSASQKEEIQTIVTAVITEANAELLDIKFIRKQLNVTVTASQTSILNEDVLNSKIHHAIDNFLHMNQLHPKFNDRHLVHNQIIRLNRLVSLTAQAPDGEVCGIPLDYNEKVTFEKLKMVPREIRDENLADLRSTPMIPVERFSFQVKDNGEHQLDLFLKTKREVKAVMKTIDKNHRITFYTLMSRALTISY
jgi:hypothetical protein